MGFNLNTEEQPGIINEINDMITITRFMLSPK